jgi:hypothetical protein
LLSAIDERAGKGFAHGAGRSAMDSRGGLTGGATADDFRADFAVRGYTASFRVRPGGKLECSACHAWLPAEDVQLRSMRRVEGVSDPSYMAAVAALECPTCDARGTAEFCFGPMCPPEDGEVLRRLDHHDRASRSMMHDGVAHDDGALVSDSGWLRGPDG